MSFIISLFLAAFALLPSYFDNGQRKRAFKTAKTRRRRWQTGVQWVLINWGLPVFALFNTVLQGMEAMRFEGRVESLAPRKQPITSVSATAWIDVLGTNVWKFSPTEKDYDRFVSLQFGQFPETERNLWRIQLRCAERESWGNDANRSYHMAFKQDLREPLWNVRTGEVAESSDHWNMAILNAMFLKNGTQVLTGEVRVVINGVIRKTFPVPAQIVTFEAGNPSPMPGTTRTNVPVRVIAGP